VERLSAAVAAWARSHDLHQDSSLWTHQRLSQAGVPVALGPPSSESDALGVEAEPLSLIAAGPQIARYGHMIELDRACVHVRMRTKS
jgi:hypothetical protein